MSPILRGVLLAAGVAAACLVTLWFSVTAGMWLAVESATGSPMSGRLFGGLVLAGAAVLLAKGLALLTRDLGQPERRR